ncbi:MAG: hypothetical protein JOZ21_07600 [Verrucomicrobia bacterium]|nr:hypothetical protein [Verrucomicrobiota bacterium]
MNDTVQGGYQGDPEYLVSQSKPRPISSRHWKLRIGEGIKSILWAFAVTALLALAQKKDWPSCWAYYPLGQLCFLLEGTLPVPS